MVYECGGVDLLMKLFEHYSGEKTKHEGILKQTLKAIGNISSHAKAASRINAYNYLTGMTTLVNTLDSTQFYLITYMVDVLSNLTLDGLKNK